MTEIGTDWHRRQVQCHARTRATHNGEPSFPMYSVPQRKRPRSYWNWPTSDLPRASLFESKSYFLLGPVGTLTNVLAPAEGLPPSTAQIAQFVHGIRILAICSCGGILQICQWYRVCDAGALRAEPLGHPFILRGQKAPARV